MPSGERRAAGPSFALIALVVLSTGSGEALAGERGSFDSYEVAFSRSVVPLRGGETQTVLTADVPEEFIIDMIGKPALNACTRELTDGWDSCLCRRTGWESIHVQRTESGLTYHLMRWSGAPGEPTPYSWNVGRTDGTPHGLEVKVVPFG